MSRADLYFAVVPEWLIYGASPRALQVYCILRRHADYGAEGDTFISRRKLATIAKCHVDTVDRALDDLVALRAIERRPRFDGGRQTSNLYTVWTVPGGGGHTYGGGVRADAEGEGGINAEGYTESPIDRKPSTDLAVTGVEASPKEMHDAMVWALVDAMGWDRDEVPTAQWGRVHAAAKQLTEIGANPGEVPQRVLVYRAKYRGAALTPTAIATNWAALRTLEVEVSDRDVQRASKRQQARAAVEGLPR